jgi:ClpP class serine protease
MSIERQESLSQRENPTDKAREQLKTLLEKVTTSPEFKDFYTSKAKDIWGKFNGLKPETQAKIAPEIGSVSNLAAGADSAQRAKTQREFVEMAQGKHAHMSAAAELSDNLAFV